MAGPGSLPAPTPHGPVRLETPRLLLTSWREEQVPDFLAIASDPEVMRHIGRGQPWAEEKVGAFVRRQMTDEPANGFCLWSVVERGSRLLIGHCGLQRLGQTGEIEIGWWLARDRWGQGLATEAARRVLAFAWEEVHLPRIVSIVQPANTASIGVMKRIGMQFERRARHGDFGLFDSDIEILVYALANPARSDASPESTTGA